MFAKPLIKKKFKIKKIKKDNKNNGHISKTIDSGFYTSQKIIGKVEKNSESTVFFVNKFESLGTSKSIDKNINDSFDLCSARCESGLNDNEDINSCETESVDSGVDLNEKAEDIFETSVSNTFTDIDISEIIDEGSDTVFTETGKLNAHTNSVKVNSRINEKLINYIENDLNSNLKLTLKKRNISKLLECDHYNYWHKCTKREMKRLGRYISKNDLMQYVEHCYSRDIPRCVNPRLIENIVNKMNSNLRELFLKREFSKSDKNQFLKYHKKVLIEWKRLQEIIPFEYLVLYGMNILFLVEKLQRR